jgi:hypothetical protein
VIVLLSRRQFTLESVLKEALERVDAIRPRVDRLALLLDGTCATLNQNDDDDDALINVEKPFCLQR